MDKDEDENESLLELRARARGGKGKGGYAPFPFFSPLLSSHVLRFSFFFLPHASYLLFHLFSLSLQVILEGEFHFFAKFRFNIPKTMTL